MNESTVRDRVNRGIETVAPCQGRKGVVKGELWDALLSALLRSYIALKNANQFTMPNTQKIIKILDKVTATNTNRNKTDTQIGGTIDANTKMEKRRLVWSA